jgi:hypothetical protein
MTGIGPFHLFPASNSQAMVQAELGRIFRTFFLKHWPAKKLRAHNYWMCWEGGGCSGIVSSLGSRNQSTAGFSSEGRTLIFRAACNNSAVVFVLNVLCEYPSRVRTVRGSLECG